MDLKKAVSSILSSARCDSNSTSFRENCWHWRRGKIGKNPGTLECMSETSVRKSPTFLSLSFFICRTNALDSKTMPTLKKLLFSVFRWGCLEFVLSLIWNFAILLAHQYLTWRTRDPTVGSPLFTFLRHSGSEDHMNSPLADLGGVGEGGAGWGDEETQMKIPVLFVRLVPHSLCSAPIAVRISFMCPIPPQTRVAVFLYTHNLVQIKRVWTVKVKHHFGVYYNQVPER